MLIPVGWLALGYANRQVRRLVGADVEVLLDGSNGEPEAVRPEPIDTEPLAAPVDMGAP
jgi:hypothetical protein